MKYLWLIVVVSLGLVELVLRFVLTFVVALIWVVVTTFFLIPGPDFDDMMTPSLWRLTMEALHP